MSAQRTIEWTAFHTLIRIPNICYGIGAKFTIVLLEDLYKKKNG